ncbi:HP1 family phage holin [Yersinia enterocolitica]|uniref:HP1 family phage holin n=1 Tax=Yersinia TaxID=629 RepID=UPI001C608332|nr:MULTISPECIES: HP1 family phage holin [Yersinia]
MEEITTRIAHGMTVMLIFIAALTAEEMAFYVATIAAAITCGVNWYYRRKCYLLLKKRHDKESAIDEFRR